MAQDEFEKDTNEKHPEPEQEILNCNAPEEEETIKPFHSVDEIVRCCLIKKAEIKNILFEELTDEDKQEMHDMVMYRINNPDASADLVQKFWKKMKEAKGWTLGTLYNAEEKIHPALKNFADLSDSQKEKVVKLIDLVDSLK